MELKRWNLTRNKVGGVANLGHELDHTRWKDEDGCEDHEYAAAAVDQPIWN